MALQADIQTKYNRATETYGQAKAILDEYSEKAMPAEKQQEVDRLFDAFDGFVAEAKRLERAREREQQIAEMNAPQNDMDAPKGMGGKPAEGGAPAGEQELKAWTKALKYGPRTLSGAESKALRADSDVDGGFLVAPQQVLTQLIKAVDDIVVMRRLGTVMQLDRAESLGVVAVGVGFHFYKVNKPIDVFFEPDWEVHRKRLLRKTGVNTLQRFVEIATSLVNLVNKANTRHTVFVSLAPYRFGLGFYPHFTVEYHNSTVEHAQ
jgi:hypothetical protein